MREASEHPLSAPPVLDYRRRAAVAPGVPWWQASWFDWVGGIAMMLVLVPVLVIALSVMTWLLLQL